MVQALIVDKPWGYIHKADTVFCIRRNGMRRVPKPYGSSKSGRFLGTRPEARCDRGRNPKAWIRNSGSWRHCCANKGARAFRDMRWLRRTNRSLHPFVDTTEARTLSSRMFKGEKCFGLNRKVVSGCRLEIGNRGACRPMRRRMKR